VKAPGSKTRASSQRDAERRKRFLAGALLAVATVVAFSPALTGDFIWDDALIFMVAPRAPSTFWFSLHQPDYWPVTYTMIWSLWRLFDHHSLGYHLVNVGIHVANIYLWWRVLTHLGFKEGRWLAVALFALHPLQVETVAYVFQLKTTLALTFFLLSFDQYLKSQTPSASKDAKPRSGRAYGFALAFFTLACLTKTSAVMLPAGLLLFHVHRQTPWREVARRLVPFIGVAVACAALTVFMSGQNTASTLIWNAGPWERLLTAGYNAWFYVGKTIFPFDLTVAYPRVSMVPGRLMSYAPLALWAAVLGGLSRFRNAYARLTLAGTLFFLSQLVPVLGLSNIFFMKWSFVADHWSYVALMGLFAPMGVFSSKIPRLLSTPKSVQMVAAGALLLGLGTLSFRHSGAFRTSSSLWDDTLAKNPNADIAFTSLGLVAYAERDFQKSLDLYRRAIAVRPDNDEAQFGAATALVALGHRSEARPFVETTLRLNPRHAKAYNELGLLELAEHRPGSAQALFERAIELDSTFAEPHGNLSLILRETRKLDAALIHQQAATALAPDDDRVWVNLGELYLQMGKVAAAKSALMRALELNPRQAMAYFNLARAYSIDPSGRPLAIDALREGLKWQPENMAARQMLATLESSPARQ